jgi:trigger factor
MSATQTLNEGLKRGYSLTIEAGAIAARVDKAIAEVAPKVRMPGFRPGKVPGNLIRRMHGPSLRAEAVQEAVGEAVQKLLADEGLRPAMQPSVDLVSGAAEHEDVKVEVALEVLPTVPEVSVDGIELERLTTEVTDADLDSALAKLAEQQKTFVDAPEGHAAATGDLVVMDYVGTVDGVAFEGGTGTDMEVELGSGRLIPGFEEGLAGAAVGEARTLSVTFPGDYPAANLAGQPAQFAVTVKAVRVAEVPAIDETLATNLGLDSLEKLREILKDQVESELNGLTRTYLKRKLLDHLAALASFEVPPSMVEAEFEQIWKQVTADASEADRVAAEAERADYARIAERRVRLGLLLSDIGQKNGIAISGAEMNRLVAQEAARYPGQEREVQKYFAENAAAAAQLRAPLFEEKVVDFLLGKAAITDRVVARADLEAAIESEDETPHAAHAHGAGEPHVHGPGCGHDHGEPEAAAPEAAAPAKKPRKPKAAGTEQAMADAGTEEPTPARKPRAKKAPAA